MILRILKSTGAVVAGFAAVVLLSIGTDAVMHGTGVFPPESEGLWDPGLNLLALAYRSVFTVLGGFVTARLAPTAPLRHAAALSLIGLAAGTAGVLATWNLNLGPHWYPIALAAEAVPLTMLGGWLAGRRAA